MLCKNDGITLYRIREGLPSLNDTSLDFIVQKDQKDLSVVIEKVLSKIIGTTINVNLEKDAIAIENLRELMEKEKSFLFFNPDVASEWNFEKNGKLKPEYFAANSNKRVWWKCRNGHEWQAVINSRNSGCGCPYCAGRFVIKGQNDLQTINPYVSEEWNFEKNEGLTPADVLPNSNKKVWWKCSEGHEWQAVVSSRNVGRGCPYCSGKKVLIGYNDLQTINPALANEWNYEKNDELNPKQFTANSAKKVWWKCNKGHEWQARIVARNKGCGCMQCYRESLKSNK